MGELKVKVQNTWSQVAPEPVELRRLLDRMYSPEIPGAEWMQRNHAKHVKKNTRDPSCIMCRSPGWDLKKHFLTKAGSLPTGLLVDAAARFAEEGHVLKLLDRRDKPEGTPRSHGVTLRDDQRQIADQFLQGHCGTIEAATAFGKTIVNVVLCAELGVPTLIVVPAKELIKQHIERFEEYGGLTPNRWKGAPPWDVGDVNIATLALLSWHIKGLAQGTKDIGLLIIDEAHHCSSRSWYKALMRIKAYYRLAQSGTLPVEDEWEWAHIMACAGPMLGSVTAADLTEREELAETRVFFLPSGYGGEQPVLGHFTEEYRTSVVRAEVRNAYIGAAITGCVDHELRALTLCKWGEHVHGLYEDAAAEVGDRVDWLVSKEMTDTEVTARRHSLDAGDIDVLIATTVFDEGLDVPELDLLIMAGGGEAEGRTKQRIGRVRRRGRTGRAVIIDFEDTHQRQIAGHSLSRRQHYIDEGCTVEDVMLPVGRMPELMAEIAEWLRTGAK